MNNAGVENVGGFHRSAASLRKQFANYSVHGDKGDIPSDHKVKYYATCADLHRGLCRFDDSRIFRLGLEVGTRLNNYLLDTELVLEGDWVTVTATGPDAFQNVLSLYVAHQRFRDPKLALLTSAACSLQPDGSKILEIEFCTPLNQCTAYGAMRRLLNGRSAGIDIEIEVYDVKNYNFRVDEEQHVFSKVLARCVRHRKKLYEATASNVKVKPPPKKKAKKADEACAAAGSIDEVFNALRTPNSSNVRLPKPSYGGISRVLDPEVEKSLEEVGAELLDPQSEEILEHLEVEFNPNGADDSSEGC